MREEVRVVKSSECGGLSECSRICSEDLVIVARPEELLESGVLPRDCVVVVEDIG
ncbi:MAG: hypothetical protein QXS85_05220 [Acidilobaceae archaeon]